MKAGDLPHRVTVNQLVETKDALNQPIQTWSTLGTYWARYTCLTGRELVIAKQIRAEASSKVEFRNLDITINEQNQLVFEDQVLGVVNVNNRDLLGYKSRITCLCKEIRTQSEAE